MPFTQVGIAMEEHRIQHLARSTAVFVQARLPDLALHLGFHQASQA